MLEKTRTFQSYMSPQWLLAISPLEHWIPVSDNMLLVENLAIVHPNIVPSEFSSSDLEKCSLASLSQQWMLYSEWVPSEWESDKNITLSAVLTLQWMGAVRMSPNSWYCDVFIRLSFWRHPFTVESKQLILWCFYQTLILTAPIHCRVQTADIAMFLLFV